MGSCGCEVDFSLMDFFFKEGRSYIRGRGERDCVLDRRREI